MRAALAGNFTDRFSVYGTIRYNEYDGPNNIWNRELNGDLTHSSIVEASYSPRHKRDTLSGSLELAYDFDNFTVTSTTSYTDTDSTRQTDLDISQEFVLDLDRSWPVNVWTQELRFTSTDDSPLQWQAGVYFLELRREKNGLLPVPYGYCFFLANCDDDAAPPPYPSVSGPPPIAANPVTGEPSESEVVVEAPFENLHEEREQLAGFANFSYRMNNVEFAGGVRVDRWEFEATNRDISVSGRQANTEVLGRASISLFFDDDRSMVYGLFSQGFEPGSFNSFNIEGENALFGSCRKRQPNTRSATRADCWVTA